MSDEVVTRLYRALVRQLRRRGHPDTRPVTVAQIYETLVPYSAVRTTIGVELNADYEHALLRLLSGERGLLRLEPDSAREELRREVNTPYPFVGLYRKFSASDVWVAMPETVAPDSPHDAGSAQPPTVRLSGGGAEPALDAPVRLHRSEPVEPDQRDPDRVPAPVHAECTFCSIELPASRRVRFCPHCGADQRLQPCPRCDAVLELEWRYCINCGHVAGD